MPDRDRFWIEEIIEQAEKAVTFASVRDEVHLLAMLKASENVWEATTALSDEARSTLFPDHEEYLDLRGARNYYVHQYHRVDGDRARLTVTRHFPDLARRARQWLDGTP